jgi:heterodisulfide reductase subunit C
VWNPFPKSKALLPSIFISEEEPGNLAMKHVIDQGRLRPTAVKTVEEFSGEDVKNCYQCGKCSAGCPIAADMDLPPNQVIRLLQLGLTDTALRSKTIWLCASCETCTTRCPREVDLATIMDALRNLAIREKIRSPERAVTLFNKIFLSIVKKYGRLFEMELIGMFNTGTLKFFKDITKAPKLLLRGRLGFLPNLEGRKTANPVFKDVERVKSSGQEKETARDKKLDEKS